MSNARAALQEAEDATREILAEKVRKDEVIDGNEFERHDKLGTRLFTLPFRDVLRLD
jgi:hypothetical protein